MITEETRRALIEASNLATGIEMLIREIKSIESKRAELDSEADSKRQELERAESALAAILNSLAPKP